MIIIVFEVLNLLNIPSAMSYEKSDLIFTINRQYYIKAIYKSLPHLVFGLDSTKLCYSNEVVQQDFAKWRSGDYDYEEHPKAKCIIIHEGERMYTFTETFSLGNEDIMWAFFDEVKRLNENIEYQDTEEKTDDTECLDYVINYFYNRNLGQNLGIQLKNPHDLSKMTLKQKAKIIADCYDETWTNLKSTKDPDFEPLMNADLREEYERVFKMIEIKTLKEADSLDEYSPTEYKNLKLAEQKLAKLITGYNYERYRNVKSSESLLQLTEKLSASNDDLDRVLELMYDFKTTVDGQKKGVRPSFRKDVKKLTLEEKTQDIARLYPSIVSFYERTLYHDQLTNENSLDTILEKMYAFNNLDSGFPTGIKFSKPPKSIKEMSYEEKVIAIHDCYNSIVEQFEYSNKFLKLQVTDLQSKHDLLIAAKNVEINRLKSQYENVNHTCGEFKDMWIKSSNDADKHNLERIEATNALMQIKSEYNQFKTEIFEKSKNSTEFDLVTCDFTFNTVNKSGIEELNAQLSKVATGFVIGIRGYWYGGDRLKFNVVQLVCNKSKPFAPFVEFKLTNNQVSYSDERAHIIVHDMLGSFTGVSLRFYYNEFHILTIDENKFVSKTISEYLDHCEDSHKTELKKELMTSTDFEVAEIAYKVHFQIDLSDTTNVDYLNKIMQDRQMKVVGGEGFWVNPLVFTVTKLTLMPVTDIPAQTIMPKLVAEIGTVPGIAPDNSCSQLVEILQDHNVVKTEGDDEFEHVGFAHGIVYDTKVQHESVPDVDHELMEKLWNERGLDKITRSEKYLKSIEKYMKKTSTEPNTAVIHSTNASTSNYNTYLLLKY